MHINLIVNLYICLQKNIQLSILMINILIDTELPA